MKLSIVPAPIDLPPAWDGIPIDWQGWSDNRTTMALHVPAEELACTECGAVDERMANSGIRPPKPGATVEVEGAHKSGGRIARKTIPAKPMRDIWAFRCRHCDHDHVWDQRTDEWWDLDADDYGPEGSTHTDGKLW